MCDTRGSSQREEQAGKPKREGREAGGYGSITSLPEARSRADGSGAPEGAHACAVRGSERVCVRGCAVGCEGRVLARLPPELRHGEETGPGISRQLIDSSYIILFPSRAYKSPAPCKNRI